MKRLRTNNFVLTRTLNIGEPSDSPDDNTLIGQLKNIYNDFQNDLNTRRSDKIYDNKTPGVLNTYDVNIGDVECPQNGTVLDMLHAIKDETVMFKGLNQLLKSWKNDGLIATQTLAGALSYVKDNADDDSIFDEIISWGTKIIQIVNIIRQIIKIFGFIAIPAAAELPSIITGLEDFDPDGEINEDNVEYYLEYYTFVLENNYVTSKSYTKDQTDTTFLTKTQATNTYLTTTDAANTYLTSTEAANTYLTPTEASNTYLTSTEAANTYLTMNDFNDNANSLVNQSQIISSTTNLINEIKIAISDGDTKIIDSTTPKYTPGSSFTSENSNCVLAAYSEAKTLYLYHSGNDSAFNNFVPDISGNYRAVIIDINEWVSSYHAQITLQLTGLPITWFDQVHIPLDFPSTTDLSSYNIVLAPENKIIVSKTLNDTTFTGNNTYSGNNIFNGTVTFSGTCKIEKVIQNNLYNNEDLTGAYLMYSQTFFAPISLYVDQNGTFKWWTNNSPALIIIYSSNSDLSNPKVAVWTPLIYVGNRSSSGQIKIKRIRIYNPITEHSQEFRGNQAKWSNLGLCNVMLGGAVKTDYLENTNGDGIFYSMQTYPSGETYMQLLGSSFESF